MNGRFGRWILLLLLAVSYSWAGAAEGDPKKGRALAIKYCSRCHVVGDYNRLGGIGSTPSFQVLTFIPDYVERVRTFFTRRPHPVFARVPDYARWSDRPPNAPVFEITRKEIEDIVAFVKTLKKRE